jgi:hypothetical protein
VRGTRVARRRIFAMNDAVPPLFWSRDPEGTELMVVEGR